MTGYRPFITANYMPKVAMTIDHMTNCKEGLEASETHNPIQN